MHTVTGHRRLSILVIVPLLAAACGGSGPTSLPSPSSAPSLSFPAETTRSTIRPLPTPEDTASPIPEPTTGPDSPCADIGAAISPDFGPPSAGASIRFAAQPADIDLWVVSATALDDPAQTWTEGPGEPRFDAVGMLPGGHDLRFRFGVGHDYEFALPITITAVRVTLRRDDGAQRELRTRLTMLDAEQVVRIKIPDIDARGWLDARVEWQDRCLSYVAIGSARIRIVPGDVVAACPTDADGINTYTEELDARPADVAGVPARFYITNIIGLWDEFFIAADGPAFSLWDRDLPPAVGDLGGTVHISESNPNLVVNGLEAFFYRRRDVVDWLDSVNTDIDDLYRVSVEPAPDGSFELRLPSDPRRYVAVLDFDWESPCLAGTSRAVVAIDVGR